VYLLVGLSLLLKQSFIRLPLELDNDRLGMQATRRFAVYWTIAVVTDVGETGAAWRL
jgi:hypothetical protein